MQAALSKLGYHDIYHMTSILTKNPRDVDMWVRAFDAIYGGKGTFGKPEWDALLGHCMAVTDTPCIDFTYELTDTYPNAKVILLTRDIDSWYESYMDTVGRYFLEYEGRYRKWYSIQRYIMSKWHVGSLFDCYFKYLGQTWFSQRGKQLYQDQTARVRHLMARKPEGQYLEFDVKQGWAPLCKFLGKEVPEGEGFPRVMERMEFYDVSKNVRFYEIILMAGNVAKMVAVGGVLGGGLWWWLGRGS